MEEFRKEKNESIIEGRNVVIEAFRSGQSVDRLYILDGICHPRFGIHALRNAGKVVPVNVLINCLFWMAVRTDRL